MVSLQASSSRQLLGREHRSDFDSDLGCPQPKHPLSKEQSLLSSGACHRH